MPVKERHSVDGCVPARERGLHGVSAPQQAGGFTLCSGFQRLTDLPDCADF